MSPAETSSATHALRPAPVVRDAAAGGPSLPLAGSRCAALLALAIFGGLHWMWMLEPAEPRRAWAATALALAAVLALLGAARLTDLPRYLAATATALGSIVGALLVGGLADEYLRPDQWGRLAAGIGRGVQSLPGINVPYRGVDQWTHLTLGVGGTGLIVAAALLAFWPRRSRCGFPALALVALVALYAVPAIVLELDGEFLRGALLALLVLAFMRLERLHVGDAGAAGAVAGAAALAALTLAPALDGNRPWWDYERWALSASSTKTASFSWDHDYGPLDWPRDGRELLRVKAKHAAYWKAQNLDLFDGVAWRRSPDRTERATAQLPDDPRNLERWTQELRVTLRNLRTDTFVTAGFARSVDARGTGDYPIGGGVHAATRTLSRGDAYRAEVYTPTPSDRQLRTARIGDHAGMSDYLRIHLGELGRAPISAPGEPRRELRFMVEFPSWSASGRAPQAHRIAAAAEQQAAGPLLERAGLDRTYTFARELRKGAKTPFELVERVERFLASGFSYSEAPPPAAATLPGFIFDAKRGFCQQYSGAMALLLRMGGVPARVATGFTTGAYDRTEREFVVRDLDAHSWVEVWFPGYGWVTRDPTPADAPPRSQANEAQGAGAPRGGDVPDLGGDRQLDPRTALAPEQSRGFPFGWILAGALALGLGAAAVAGERRRRRRLPAPAQRTLLELERALRRARFDEPPGMTLRALERALAGGPGAVDYLRALSEQRYSDRSVTLTRAQRSGLRAALARHAGPLRAWWALPPWGPAGSRRRDAR